MTPRSLFPWLVAAAALGAGCPIPQTVPEYPKGSPITPPRIVAESVTPQGTVLTVPAGCATGPTYALHAQIVDEDTAEPVTVRLFVDYDPALQAWYRPWQDFAVSGDSANPNETRRDVDPPAGFAPYEWPLSPTQAAAGMTDPAAAGVLHVVEMVVSNGFDPTPDQSTLALPYRTPVSGFETQVYRWVFLLVNDPGACPP